MFSVGKIMIIAGGLMILFGLVFMAMEKFKWFGRLPGDVHVESERFSFHFPIVTSIIISIILTVLLNLFFRNR